MVIQLTIWEWDTLQNIQIVRNTSDAGIAARAGGGVDVRSENGRLVARVADSGRRVAAQDTRSSPGVRTRPPPAPAPALPHWTLLWRNREHGAQSTCLDLSSSLVAPTLIGPTVFAGTLSIAPISINPGATNTNVFCALIYTPPTPNTPKACATPPILGSTILLLCA